MNRRTLKKHCNRAMETLIEKHGYQRENFVRATGDGDWKLPSDVLQEIEFWAGLSNTDARRLLGENPPSIGGDIAASAV